MADFSTEFPIASHNSVPGAMRAACTWLSGSPHTTITEDQLVALPENGERVVSSGFERAEIAHAQLSGVEIGGLRYERTEDDLAWTTSIVTLKGQDRQILSIQVSCEALNAAGRLPPPRKPYFIRQAIEKLGGGSDGDIPVADRPFRLSVGDETAAAALLLGTARNTLPIVYVSAGYDNGHFVDSVNLARYLAGMAHVVVEPNRAFSLELRRLTAASNAYGGAVGIYWPDSEARTIFLPDPGEQKRGALEVAIGKSIRVALSNRRQRTNCTWTYLKEAIAKVRLDQLRAEGSTELQAYVEAFDAELAAKEARVQEGEREIARLNAELRRHSSMAHSAQGLLLRGKEQDLYGDEIRDIVIDALADALKSTGDNSRRQHVISDLLAANNLSGNRAKLEDEIKTLLKTYRDMDARTRTTLQKLGFALSEDGKHYKAVFQDDARYVFTLPKTSSDSRAGKNMASDINKVLF